MQGKVQLQLAMLKVTDTCVAASNSLHHSMSGCNGSSEQVLATLALIHLYLHQSQDMHTSQAYLFGLGHCGYSPVVTGSCTASLFPCCTVCPGPPKSDNRPELSRMELPFSDEVFESWEHLTIFSNLLSRRNQSSIITVGEHICATEGIVEGRWPPCKVDSRLPSYVGSGDGTHVTRLAGQVFNPPYQSLNAMLSERLLWAPAAPISRTPYYKRKTTLP